MKRVLLILVGVVLALCVICVGLGYFVAIPRVKDGVQEGIHQAVATNVAPLIAGIGIDPKPGAYTLTEDQVNQQIQTSGADLKDLHFDITPNGLDIQFGEQGQDVGYTTRISAVDGKIVVDDSSVSGIPTWIIPAGAISSGIEDGINDYLAEHGLVVTSVTMQDGNMTLTLENAAATPTP